MGSWVFSHDKKVKGMSKNMNYGGEKKIKKSDDRFLFFFLL
jgi:hypothetical protein